MLLPMQDARRVRRVLVADDERDIAGFLQMTLEMHGYQVQAVYDGREAWELAKRTLPDLVILDVMMPRMTGLEVLTRLRTNPDTAEIPVVMLTAKASDADVWDGWQAGASYYLTKPFDLDELLRYLAVLEESAARTAS